MGDDISDDTARQARLRHNRGSDPENKTDDELDPMEADSWSGGSIDPTAKKIARGEAPADRERGPGMPPSARTEPPPSSTRPWSPEPTEGDAAAPSGVDHTGRPRGPQPDD